MYILVFAVVLLQVCLMILTFYLASLRFWSFEPADIVAAFFCSTHKSLTLGTYFVNVQVQNTMPTCYIYYKLNKETELQWIPLSRSVWSLLGTDLSLSFCNYQYIKITIIFTSVGIPILKIVYGGDPQLSVMSIPLLIYHPTQILLGGLLVPSVRGWMSTTKTFR